MFYEQLRDLDAPVCSVFRKRDGALKKEVNNGNR